MTSDVKRCRQHPVDESVAPVAIGDTKKKMDPFQTDKTSDAAELSPEGHYSVRLIKPDRPVRASQYAPNRNSCKGG